MPPVFGPASPSSSALEVLRAGQRERADAVAEGEDRDLLALQQLLDDERVAEGSGGLERGVELASASRQTKTPLPAARPSALTTHGGRARRGRPRSRRRRRS